jgi:hypothetical protein
VNWQFVWLEPDCRLNLSRWFGHEGRFLDATGTEIIRALDGYVGPLTPEAIFYYQSTYAVHTLLLIFSSFDSIRFALDSVLAFTIAFSDECWSYNEGTPAASAE